MYRWRYLGDPCPECKRVLTETAAGGTLAGCWWCEDRAADTTEVPP